MSQENQSFQSPEQKAQSFISFEFETVDANEIGQSPSPSRAIVLAGESVELDADLVARWTPIADEMTAESHADNDLIEVRPQFAVIDRGSANWVVRKYKEAIAYAESVKIWAASEKKRADAAREFYLGRYGPEIEALTLKEIEGQRTKSVNLPAGRIGVKSVSVRIELGDENQLEETVNWAMENLPSAIKSELVVEPENFEQLGEYLNWLAMAPKWVPAIELRVKKSVLDANFKATNQVPDGCKVVGGTEEFYIR